MPQLDKISFATQYLWLTLFFFPLYFLTTNFFVILVFKNLRLRNIVYNIWYFFAHQFNYEAYQHYSNSLFNNSFNLVHASAHTSLLTMLKRFVLISSFMRVTSFIELPLQNKHRALISKIQGLENIIIHEA